MVTLYIGLAIALVLIFAVFGGIRLKQNHDIAVANATPTPGPNASEKPINLANTLQIGKPSFPPGNTKGGGFGSPVDGIECATMEQQVFHIHTQLSLFVKGKQIEIPRFIGMVPNANGGCLYWLHTHDASGVIHVESPEIRDFTLGNFFHVWGEDLSRTQVGPYSGPVTAYVNGGKYDGDLSAIPLRSHQEITLEVGMPLVTPPNYTFPPNE